MMSKLRLSYIVPVAALALAAGLPAVSASAAPAASGTWTLTGSMNSVRFDDTATVLPNGEVLAAGGATATSTLASAELYNPATGQWGLTGSMNAPRQDQTATLLPGGKVLAAGGSGNSNALSSAELYNPATGTWARTGSMTTPREDQTATLLSNGQVLEAGGVNGAGATLASAELYNPATGKWTQTGSMGTARETHDATLLPDGDVLVTSGVQTSGSFSELYHPATGKWSAATGGLSPCTLVSDCRFGSSATLLGTGEVLVAGGLTGTSSNPGSTTSAMLYNPATNAWTTTGPLNTGRIDQTENLLADGQVLAAGGESFARHARTLLASAELYTP
jgi:hypothetical protein